MELRPIIVQVDAPEVVELPMEAVETRGRPSLVRRLLKWAVLLVLIVVCVDGAASLLVRRDRVRKRLDARLEAAFGRPVEVQNYSFSLWGGPTLEADGISVGEDPRFGREYFLRADSLSVRLRWLSLLRGRFELGALSLSSPTVNIVTDASGNWNLAEWLGHPAAPAANVVGPMRIPFVPKFRQIDVDDGRINFKRGDDKLPFAFIGVTGSIYADGPERWRLDLEAAPWRAAELSQQAGTIHLSGSVGGTSSALRPANVQLSWADASASDFLRLLTGDDSGVRGSVAIGINAQTVANSWTIQAQALLGDLHRWDVTLRPDAPALDVPALNVTAKMLLDLPASTLQITQALVEAPHSNVQMSGKVSWLTTPANGKQPAASPVNLEIQSASVDFSDLLVWLRAFRPNVPAGLAVTGFAQAQGNISGWPARLTNMTAQSYGAELSGAGLVTPIHLGEADVTYDHGSFRMMPATVTIGGTKSPPAGVFHVDFNAPTNRLHSKNPSTSWHLAGSATDAADVIAVATAFGWDVARGWQLAGPLRCDLRWPQTERPWAARPVGTVTIGGVADDAASLHASFLNLPVSGLALQIDLQQGGRHVTVSSADAFGAHWTGTFDRSDAAPMWQFALSADQLSTTDLDRWLNPRWRESFLDRMLPFLNSAPATAVPDNLLGTGRLTVGTLSALPFALRNFSADATIDGRKVTLDRASADLSGGQITGSFQADLLPTPNYQARATFSAIDVGLLGGDSEQSQAPFVGRASGNIDFSMKGTSRADFANSLTCKGIADVHDAVWRGVRLSESLQAAKLVPGETSFGGGSSQFTCANAGVSLSNIVLAAPSSQIAGTGTVDLAGKLDLDLHVVKDTGGAESTRVSSVAPGIHVTGTPSAPEFSRLTPGRRPR